MFLSGLKKPFSSRVFDNSLVVFFSKFDDCRRGSGSMCVDALKELGIIHFAYYLAANGI